MKFFSLKLIALLSAAIMVASAPSISANIPAIAADFPSVSPVYVSLLTTIPSLFLIFGVFSTNLFERFLGRKYTIITGLTMVGIFGTLPAWYQGSFFMLFLSRCLLGIGIGLFNRLIIQMISSLYQDSSQKRARALGLESACEGLGGVVLTIGVGQLLKINWTYSFLVYCMAFLGAILIMFFIPKDKLDGIKNNREKKDRIVIAKNRKIKMYLMGLFLFCIVVLFINYNLQITPLLIEQGLGSATEGSNMIASLGAGAFLAGNLFGKNLQLLGEKLLPIATYFAGIFIFLSLYSHSATMTLFCSLGLGFSFRNIMPYFMHSFTSGGEKLAEVGTTIVLVAYNLGATLSPYISEGITLISQNSSATHQLFITGILYSVLGCIALIFNKKMSFN